MPRIFFSIKGQNTFFLAARLFFSCRRIIFFLPHFFCNKMFFFLGTRIKSLCQENNSCSKEKIVLSLYLDFSLFLSFLETKHFCEWIPRETYFSVPSAVFTVTAVEGNKASANQKPAYKPSDTSTLRTPFFYKLEVTCCWAAVTTRYQALLTRLG